VIALVIGAALAVAALVYVLFPLFDAVSPVRARVPSGVSASPQSAVEALREIEFDRATGKLSDDDYSALKAEYTRAALVEMRGGQEPTPVVASDAGATRAGIAAPEPNDSASVGVMDAAEAAVLRHRTVRRTCETCGPRPEPDPVFCSSCGKYLKGVCAHCGATVDAPASRFCARCGSSLAA